MISSISSFKSGFIGRTLATCGILLVSYNVWLHFSRPEVLHFQNQWQANSVAAEEYVHGHAPRKAVMVGSSMSARLDGKLLGDGIWNLGLSSGSSATGLEIVARSGNLPRMVLVEANQIKAVDTPFVEGLFHPVAHFLKGNLPSARTRYQPMNILVNKVKSGRNTLQQELTPDAFARILEIQKRGDEKVLDPAELDRNVSHMAKAVETLASRGVTVVFFRMPVHPDLKETNLSLAIQARMKKAFPETRYKWLEDRSEGLSTLDGVHLTVQSAQKHSVTLRGQMESSLGL